MCVYVCVCVQVTRVDGEQLLKYRGELERVLCVCVRVRCKRAYALACGLLEHSLRSLSLIYPTEYRSTAGGFHTDLPIRVNGAQARFPRPHWSRGACVYSLGRTMRRSGGQKRFLFLRKLRRTRLGSQLRCCLRAA